MLEKNTNPDHLQGNSPELDTPCRVHYEGKTIDGNVFDSSFEREVPALLKPSQLIQGWQEALSLMKAGDKWKIVLPSDLGYGDKGTQKIGKIGNPYFVYDYEQI